MNGNIKFSILINPFHYNTSHLEIVNYIIQRLEYDKERTESEETIEDEYESEETTEDGSEDDYEKYYPKIHFSKKDEKNKKGNKKEKNDTITRVDGIPHINGIINKKRNWKSDYLKEVQENLSKFVYTKEEQKKVKKIISKKIRRKNKNFKYILRDNLLTKESKELNELDEDWLSYLEELYDRQNTAYDTDDDYL